MPKSKKSFQAEPLLVCPRCKHEMRLLGIEVVKPSRDLYTFECDHCGQVEIRTIRTA